MHRMRLLSMAVALAAILAPSMASAQDDSSKPVTLKLGVFLPTSGQLKNSVGNSWLAIGADYAFKPATVGVAVNPAQPLVYLDYAGRNGSGNQQQAQVVNVGFGERYTFEPTGGSAFRLYLGGGIGAAFVRAKSTTTSSVSNGDGGTTTYQSSLDKNVTNFGFKVNGGLDFPAGYVLDLAYWNSGKVIGTSIGGVVASVGVKF